MTTRTQQENEWTIERWRTEPEWRHLEIDDPVVPEDDPALWKDLTLATLTAGLLWTAAVMLLG